MLSFNFGNKNSYEDFGILISQRPSISSPKRRVSKISIPGRNSNLIVDEKTYDDITLSVECSVKDNDNIMNKLDDIKAWLFESGESDLIFDFQSDKKYIAQVVNSIDFKVVYKYISQFPIIFNCRPFKYETEMNMIEMAKEGIILNPGSMYSDPIIKIFGSGDITLNINSEVIKLKQVKEHIILDAVHQNCYSEDIENLNSNMSGEFPKLQTGENNISWTGAVYKVEVTPNWRWL